eukprot:TRINITY_DN431_c0_g1_i1.p1 TRINITY_DN431_c0_g1~~TRINITY_DN431_c0_g1_i1.p1  ORF type:complete len:212 (-),score=75.54 TRINITY_DN431_c0_g1_i1:233-868(-)
MSITYILVGFAGQPIVEFSQNSPQGNESLISRQILQRLPTNSSQRKTYNWEGQSFHTLTVDTGLSLICMANIDKGYKAPYAYLENVRQRFNANYNLTTPRQIPEFTRTLEELMRTANDEDQITKVKGEIQQVRVNMIENIDELLDRGEKIENLMDKTDLLTEQSGEYSKMAVKVKNEAWWRKQKSCICIICIGILVVIVAIVVVILAVKVF